MRRRRHVMVLPRSSPPILLVMFILACFVCSPVVRALLHGPAALRSRPLHPRGPQFGGSVGSSASPSTSSRLTRAAETEGGSSSGSSSSSESGGTFDWTNFTEPEEYVWYLRDDGGEKRNSNRAPGQADDITVQWNAPITILAFLFFVPLFSAEFFFAISRSFICSSPWTADLCSEVPNFAERI